MEDSTHYIKLQCPYCNHAHSIDKSEYCLQDKVFAYRSRKENNHTMQEFELECEDCEELIIFKLDCTEYM